MIESWDGRVVSFLGDPALKGITPNVDRLAARGTAFRNMYTTQPICCPARANFWTGMYTYHAESWNNHKGLERGTPILKDVLEKVGYQFASDAGGIGKHDYLSGGHSQQNRVTAWTGPANIRRPAYLQEAPLIDESDTREYHSNDWWDVEVAKMFLSDHVEEQAEARKKKKETKPFFLYLSLRAPHPRFKTNRYWYSKIDLDAVTAPSEDKTVHPVMEFQRLQKDWRHGLSDEDVKRTRSIYYAMVAETDAMIGDILDYIDELGLRDSTQVILTADHGENNMEHRMFYKMNMYDSSAKVPLVIAGPGIQQGKILDNIVSLVDLYPTMLDMAGVDRSAAPNVLDGESLLPLLKGETTESRDWAFSMHTGTAANTSMFMLRKGPWKYIAYPGYPPQLFNLDEDPDEIDDLAVELPEIVSGMDKSLMDVVDYHAVHSKWIAYCKASFKKWREAVRAKPIPLYEYGSKNPAATYEQVMANTYKGWTHEDAAQLERWLESDEEIIR